MSNQILENVQSFLKMATDDSVAVSDKLIDEFGEMCKDAFRKQFTNKREKSFRARMSNIGKPLCQLQMEKSNAKPEGQPYNNKMRNTFGDLIEALAVTIIKASGIKVDSTQKSVSYNIDKSKIDGTYDIEISNSIYDIKSASPYAFEHKFGDEGGFNSIVEDDSFGYLSQGYLYSESENKRFGGWIVINKSTGEWLVTETPTEDEKYKNIAINLSKENLHALDEGKPFRRCFSDIEETFRKIPTGNKVLGIVCSFCPYKFPCWGKDKLQYLPQQQSKGKSPKWVYYTEVNNPRETSENTQ
tara:strand:+ start:306 stop:1205 length:900 start_codon:yes stop_codon:yes gene_type:complete